MSGHTKGPWEAYHCGTTYYNGPTEAGDPHIITSPNDGVILAVCVPDVVPGVAANANLIAAAPELLEALHNVLDLARIKWGNLDPDADVIFAKADAAISKAEADTQTPEQSR